MPWTTLPASTSCNASRRRPQAFSVLAFDGDTPVGLVNCIEGFSTFACRPLCERARCGGAYLPATTARRVGEQMLQLVEQIARERKACKLTLKCSPAM